MRGLLDPSFLTELEALRRRLEIRARSGGGGDQTSKRRGSSAEFQDHRPYSTGDDLRRMDWAAYARTGEPVLKLFRAEEDSILRMLVDCSGSLEHGSPSKLEVACRTAAAIGYMVLAGGQRAQVVGAADGIRLLGRVSRGRGGLATYFRDLERLRPKGGTDLAQAIDAVVRRSPRPGMLIVASDFLDPGPVTASLSRARAAGHDVGLVHVVTPEEMQPVMEGDWTLEDAETGATVDVTMDVAAVDAYVMRFSGLCEELRGMARRHAATYVRIRTDEGLDGAVRRFVGRAVD